eukprot:gnl/MRDRNA2_/MRDRNA2_125908_c0_seq1.p1 gnl/MRDRNA2_/MRDRNA2_125908_c0~~gnl/MRDRNA2_/MRDRNA2_125908_c0_seq1.p1  ORF type:complete len:276 (+),score=70.03 gnl/MRDRNA2_/MRDRNA2_125908_c0_seq1:40-867(+)
MRLGQLARKLDIKPTEIVNFLKEQHSIELELNPNAKLEDEHVELVNRQYSVEEAEVPTHLDPVQSKEEEEENTNVKEEPDGSGEDTSEAEHALKSAEDIAVPQNLDEVEHIETNKPEPLPGLKVIDKIDLPPPPPPEMIEVDGVMMEKSEYRKKKAEEKKRKQGERKPKDITRSKSKRTNKDEVSSGYTVEDERKKQEKALLKRLEKKKKLEEQKRKEFYQHKHAVKQSSPKKKKAIRKEKEIEEEQLKEELTARQAEEHAKLTTLQKIWKWFNT